RERQVVRRPPLPASSDLRHERQGRQDSRKRSDQIGSHDLTVSRCNTIELPMPSDPPKIRPLERFWPYAELPEQPTDEELARLDPDLYEALFGEKPRPFSISLVFPTLDVPDFDKALALARESAEFFDTGSGAT